jgi:HD-GYP domain-containing protein (c-di-GMP phosphodiesterase class II)
MDTVESLFQRFEKLNEVGAALSRERNIHRLLESILLAAKAITRADGGTLYLLTPDKQYLRFEIVRTDSLGIALGGTTGQSITGKFPDLPLSLPDGSPNNNLVAAYAANTGLTVNIPDAYAAEGFDFSGTHRFDRGTGYRSRSFLTVPMKNHEGDLIGVLQLLNATDPATGQVTEFSAADQRLAESLASQAAVALSNRQLLQQLEDLFESFVKLINVAIDEKSPYTGGHCERVPELTMMLADAVNDIDEGPLAQVKLTEKDFYELRIAALLHDCGKITTPVHVVDKATKLETIFDRIKLVDTRFDLLHQQAEAAMWRAVATGQQTQAEAQAAFDGYCARLQQDRAFLRVANVGGERMRDDDIERVKTMAAAHRWTDLDGASHPLLNDEEVYNLTIRAGTLTAEEREVINHHIVATINMLEQLPWPKELRNVPEYAGGHHERMDGKGYPKGLKRDEMSWQARMMGIADIFEALTANDRPYKKAMNLSQALKIMDNFKANGHIDPDLYEVFLAKQVHKRYAERFLAPEQIDL